MAHRQGVFQLWRREKRDRGCGDYEETPGVAAKANRTGRPSLFTSGYVGAPMDAEKLRAMANRCRELLEHAGTEELWHQLRQWAEEFDAEADGGREGVGAAKLGAVVAEDSRCPPADNVTTSNGKKLTPRRDCF
jgi:hypothetical protein